MENSNEKAVTGIPFSELKTMVDTYRSHASSQTGYDVSNMLNVFGSGLSKSTRCVKIRQ